MYAQDLADAHRQAQLARWSPERYINTLAYWLDTALPTPADHRAVACALYTLFQAQADNGWLADVHRGMAPALREETTV